MKKFLTICLCLAWNFELRLSAGWRSIPRLILNQDTTGALEYPNNQSHTVFFHPEGSNDLYVGGAEFVLQIDVDANNIIERYPLRKTGVQEKCTEDLCENVITVIQMFQDSLFVCGTNGRKPQCWKLYSQVNNQSHQIVESYEGTGISPYDYKQNSLSLTVEGDLYAAAPLNQDGSMLQFRRKAGSRTNVWMHDKWVSEPTFVSASWVKRIEDADNEKIYVFFREKNSDTSPEADPWISRVARVCKVDEGGSKRFFQNTWTSFLKARFVCGFQKESLYFNRLQDIYVQHAENWTDTIVYALFTSSWNSTAVCMYSMADIDQLFESSTFKGYNKAIPIPRPGTCVKNSKSLPFATVNVVKDHSEMTDWIHPFNPLAPFYTSNHNYTKIAVDRVRAVDQQIYNVLLLATDSGKIHKILQDGSEAFIISQSQLSNHSGTIRSMKLDSKKKKLIVGFSEQVSSLDLQSCKDYNGSCEECVLARDPYCAWTNFGCTPTALGGIQNIAGGQINVCLSRASEEPITSNRSKRETPSASSSPILREVHLVSSGVPLYLSCPIDSYHAVYHFEHQDGKKPCLQVKSNCLLLIPAMGEKDYGDYKCVSKESYYHKVVQEYHLDRHAILSTNFDDNKSCILKDGTTTLMLSPQVGCLSVTVLAIFSWLS